MTKKAWVLRIGALALFAHASGCDEDPTRGSYDGGSQAVVEASVQDPFGDPVRFAGISGIGRSGECDGNHPLGPVGAQGTTDAEGWARLTFVAGLSAPGRYCVGFVIRPAGTEAVDTVSGFQVEFFRGVPPDTARIVIEMDPL